MLVSVYLKQPKLSLIYYIKPFFSRIPKFAKFNPAKLNQFINNLLKN